MITANCPLQMTKLRVAGSDAMLYTDFIGTTPAATQQPTKHCCVSCAFFNPTTVPIHRCYIIISC